VRAADACDDLSPLCNAGGFVQQRGRAQIRPDQTSRACKLQLTALSWLSWLLWWDGTSGASGDTNASADCGVELYSTPFGSQGCVASMHCALKIPYGSLHPRSLVCLLAALFHLTIRSQAAGAQCHGRPTGGNVCRAGQSTVSSSLTGSIPSSPLLSVLVDIRSFPPSPFLFFPCGRHSFTFAP
jgi:hypothetical protein